MGPLTLKGQRRCSDRFTPDYLLGFTGSIKTLIIRIQKKHQRMPCNFLPPREQVAPTALHRSDITPSSHTACWIQAGHSLLASAVHGTSWNGSSPLTTSFTYFSACALSALQSCPTQHCTRQRPERGRVMLTIS